MFRPLFKRIAIENNEIPQMWEYEKIPHNVKVQIWREICKLNRINSISFNKIIDFTIDYLCDEIGTNKLGDYHGVAQLENFLYNGFGYFATETQNFRYCLSTIEIICRQFAAYHKNKQYLGSKEMGEYIKNINYRLREAKIGWTFDMSAEMLVRIDNEATYQLAVEPLFKLLTEKKFTETQENFIKAYQFYQEGGYKNFESAIDYAVKTLESAIRNICVIKKYKYTDKDTLWPLIQTLITNKFLPNYNDDYLNSIGKILLESGTIRNKNTGHGKEEEKAKAVKPLLTDDLVQFVLSQVASCVVFLVKNLKK